MTRRFKRLLITGGAGFIGSHFAAHMRQQHPEVELVILDKLTYAGNLANLASLQGQEGFRFLKGDICDPSAVAEAAQGCDAIVSFAAETHVDRSLLNPGSFVLTDVYGTYVLMEQARRLEHQIFVLVSTDEVYGSVADGRMSEHDPMRPTSPYSATKAGAEMLAWAYRSSYGFPTVVTRGSNTYGPNQFPEKIIPLFITNAIDDQPLPIYGDGRATRDYLHVDDHCAGIALALFEGEVGQAYNLGTGSEVDGITVAGSILELLGKPAELLGHVADRPGHDHRYALDCGRARSLGWQPRVGFQDGLARTVAWYVANQHWWRPLKSADFLDFYQRNYRWAPPDASSVAPPTG